MKVEIEVRMIARGFSAIWHGEEYIGMVCPKGPAPSVFVPPVTRATRSSFDVCVNAGLSAWARKRGHGKKIWIQSATGDAKVKRVYQVQIT